MAKAKCFVCVVGGTGSRIGSALVNTLLAGIDQQDSPNAIEELHLLSIDADLGSNDTNELRIAAEDYECVHAVMGQGASFANSKLQFYAWQPTIEQTDTLIDMAGKYADASLQQILDALYTEEQQNINVNDTRHGGYRANPNVGVCFLNAAKINAAGGLQKFIDAFNQACGVQGNVVRLIMAGSLFGGTGASAFVTIASHLKQIAQNANVEDFHCAAVMMTPYFRIGEERADEFYSSTKEALMYYSDPANHLPFENYYYMGSPILRAVEKKEQNQKNSYSFVEAEAAEAVLDFCMKSCTEITNAVTNNQPAFYKQKGAFYAEQNANPLNLSLDFYGRAANSWIRLVKMVRFCFNYLYVVEPFYLENEKSIQAAGNAPKYAKKVFEPLFKEQGLLQNTMRSVFFRYLRWMKEMLDDSTIQQNTIDKGRFDTLLPDVNDPAIQERYAFDDGGLASGLIKHPAVPYRSQKAITGKMVSFTPSPRKPLNDNFSICMSEIFELKGFINNKNTTDVAKESSLPLIGLTAAAALGQKARHGYYFTTQSVIEGNIGALDGGGVQRTAAVPDVLQPDFRLRAHLRQLNNGAIGGHLPEEVWSGLSEETQNAILSALALHLLVQHGYVKGHEQTVTDIGDKQASFAKVLAEELKRKGVHSFTCYTYSIGNQSVVVGYQYADNNGIVPFVFKDITTCPAAKTGYVTFNEQALNILYAQGSHLSLVLHPTLPPPNASNVNLYKELQTETQSAQSELLRLKNQYISQQFGQVMEHFARCMESALTAVNKSLEQSTQMKAAALAESMVRSWLWDTVAVADGQNFNHTVYSVSPTPYTLPLSDAFFDAYNHNPNNNREDMDAFVRSFEFNKSKDANEIKVKCKYQNTSYSFTLGLESRKCPPAMVWPPEPCDLWVELGDSYFLYSQEALDPEDPDRENDREKKMWLRAAGQAPEKNRVKKLQISQHGEVTVLEAFPTRFDVIGWKGQRIGSVWTIAPATITPTLPGGYVGIDFGSTNTTVAYRGSEGNSQLLTLGSDVFKICDGDGDDPTATLLNFHNGKAGGTPDIFMTLLNDHRVEDVAHKSLATASIPFTRTLTPDMSAPQFARIRMNLKFNYKGEFDKEQQSNCYAFLKRVFSEVRWALIKNNIKPNTVQYVYAVPSSMNPESIKNIDTIMQDELPDSKRIYEAEAVGALVLGHRPPAVQPASGFACVDIGGGSIDISLWQAPDPDHKIEPVGQLSVNSVAGKGLMQWIMRCFNDVRPELEEVFTIYREELKMVDGSIINYLEKMNDRADQGDINNFNLYYNARAEEIWLLYRKAQIHYVGRDEVKVLCCKRGIELYFCMIAYFVGQMVGASIKGGAMKAWPEDKAKRFELFFAGNGSKFMNLAGGAEIRPRIEKCFLAGVRKEIDSNTKIGGVIVSDSTAIVGADFKHEVAKGLCDHFSEPRFTPAETMPGTIWGFDDPRMNFDANDFQNVFGTVGCKNPDESFDICSRTDLGGTKSYDCRFRDALEEVLKSCDIQ